MAVKASNSITVYDQTDVLKVTTFYQRVSLTANPPAAPTTTQTSAAVTGWSTTMPAYGSSYRCYKVERSERGDGTCVWGTVTEDQAWTGANGANSTATDAQTAANAASDKVDDIEANTRAWYAECPTAAGVETKVATITPATTAFTLVKGQRVAVLFSATNTVGTGSVKLNVNGTGAKNIKYLANGAKANLPAANYLRASQVVDFIYDGDAWVTDLSYNSNDINRMLYSQAVKARAQDSSHTGYVGTHIICGTVDGYVNIAAGSVFDLMYPLLWYATAATTTIAAGSTANNHYLRYHDVKYTVNGTITSGAAYKMLYLKGTISGDRFTIAASPFMTTVVPTTEDGFVYIPLGSMTSATNGSFVSSSELYAYKDGKFGPISLREASAAAKTATNYVTETSNGVKVHPEGDDDDYAYISPSGLEVFDGGTSVAAFGGTARVGNVSSPHVRVEADGTYICSGKDSNNRERVLGKYGSSTVLSNSACDMVIDSGMLRIQQPSEKYFIGDTLNETVSTALSAPFGTTSVSTYDRFLFGITQISGDDHSTIDSPALPMLIKSPELIRIQAGSSSATDLSTIPSVEIETKSTAGRSYVATYGNAAVVSGSNITTISTSSGPIRFITNLDTLPGHTWSFNADGTSSFPGSLTAQSVLIKMSNFSRLKFGTTQSTAESVIEVRPDSSNSNNGNVMMIDPGGNLIMGGGEFSWSMYGGSIDSCDGTGENTYLGADGTVYIYTNANTIANRNKWTLGTNGETEAPAHIIIKKSGMDTTASSISANTYGIFGVRDTSGSRYASYIQTVQEASTGKITLTLAARRYRNSANLDNKIDLVVNADGTRSVSVSDAAIWRKALGLNGTTTNNTNQIGSLGSGVTVTSVVTRKNPCMCSVQVKFKKSSAIAANDSVTVGTLTAGNRPVGLDARGVADQTDSQVRVSTAGAVIFYNGMASSIAANTEITAYATFAL